MTWTHAAPGQFGIFLAAGAVILNVVLGLLLRRATRAAQVAAASHCELRRLQTPLFAAFGRLLSRPPSDGPAASVDVLAELGQGLGADRAYVLAGDAEDAVLHWARPGSGWPAGWPEAVRNAALTAAKAGDVMNRSAADKAGDDELGAALRTEGLPRWCGVPFGRADGSIGVLALDYLHSGRAWPLGEDEPLRVAGQLLAAALRRNQDTLGRHELETTKARARRLEAIGAFATGIAHNINNVVGAVMGHVEMAMETSTLGSSTSYHLREIARAGERAQEMVASIMQFGTRPGASQTDLHDVRRLIDGVASMVRVTIPSTIELVVDLDKRDSMVRGNVAHLQQIFINLIRNASQAIEGKGRVAVSVTTETSTASQTLSHDVLMPGHYVRFAVSDTGCGMSSSVASRIFEPFFTTKPGGAGLGLATVREAVHDHGGALDVVSTRARGSVFTLWLPAADPADNTPRTRGNGEVVLLVSSDEKQLRRDEETVAALGYEPRGIASVEAAILLAAAGADTFVAMVLETRSTQHGVDAVRRIRDRTRVPVVLIIERLVETGFSDVASLDLAAVLYRPLSSVSLAAALTLCGKIAGRASTKL